MNPFLLDNWDSLSLKELTLNRASNLFPITSQLEFGGLGLHQSAPGNLNVLANFHAMRPALPFYANDDRTHYDYVSTNCLAVRHSEEQKLLLFSHGKKIIGLSLDDNKLINKGSAESSLSKSHRYSSERAVNYGPFRYCTDSVTELYSWSEDTEQLRPVFGLKLNDCFSTIQQIQTNSRNRINFFKFSDEEEFDFSLDMVTEIHIDSLRRSDDSLFDECDRNKFVDNQLLISYTKDKIIDLYDMETLATVGSFDSLGRKPVDHIGLEWSEDHPQMFFYGEHKKLVYCDARQLRPAMRLLRFNKCKNLYNWELLYKFLPSKLNPNQVLVGTDYHVTLVDRRYPGRSINQLKHMLPSHFIRSMDSSLIKWDDVQNEILVSSNLYRNCLMTFSTEPNVIQITSNHLPLHFANIDDIYFYKFRKCFYRGLKIITSSDGFSVAFLSNFGDIFIQDFYWDNPEVIDRRQTKDVAWNEGIGSSDLLIDRETVEYMKIIQKFLEEENTKQLEVPKPSDLNDRCLRCTTFKRYYNNDHLIHFFNQEAASQECEEQEFICEKYFKEDFLEFFDQIDEQKLCCDLWEQSVDLSKELLSLWNDVDKEVIDINGGSKEEGVT